MVWDGKERRAGTEQRMTERRGPLSQTVAKAAPTVNAINATNATNRRKDVRRREKSLAVGDAEQPTAEANPRLRDLRARSLRQLDIKIARRKPRPGARPELHLVKSRESGDK